MSTGALAEEAFKWPKDRARGCREQGQSLQFGDASALSFAAGLAAASFGFGFGLAAGVRNEGPGRSGGGPAEVRLRPSGPQGRGVRRRRGNAYGLSDVRVMSCI